MLRLCHLIQKDDSKLGERYINKGALQLMIMAEAKDS